MILTDKQQKGLEIAVSKYKNGEHYVVISGYAGTGKSTLVKYIVEALHVRKRRVVYTAFTGKACNVLKEKGNRNVETLHHLLYEHYPQEDGSFKRLEIETIPYDVVVVDECSMADKVMVDLLLSHENVFVIFLGDPFQLPSLGEDNGLLKTPDIFLDEIQRQALDNEIIKFSMDIREGNPLPKSYKGKNVQIYSREELSDKMMLWADQILCSTNSVRVGVNNQMRNMFGFVGAPKVGDKIICLKNDWDTIDSLGEPLVNGTICTITSISEDFYPVIKKLKIPNNKIPFYRMDVKTESGAVIKNLVVDKQLFFSNAPYLTSQEKYKVGQNSYLKKRGIQVPHEFTYAYAITTWKAQGGEWEKILVIEEDFPNDTLTHKQVLYTAITRASEKVVIIRR